MTTVILDNKTSHAKRSVTSLYPCIILQKVQFRHTKHKIVWRKYFDSLETITDFYLVNILNIKKMQTFGTSRLTVDNILLYSDKHNIQAQLSDTGPISLVSVYSSNIIKGFTIPLMSCNQ